MNGSPRIATTSRGTSDYEGATPFSSPLRTGRLISMVVKQYALDRRSGEGAPSINVRGIPGSRAARANQASITFLGSGLVLPAPAFDEQAGRIRLFYPVEELQAVMDVLTARSNRMCYLWQANDGERALAWLLAL